MAEKVLVRCPCGGKVSLIGYMDEGRLRYDLHTDGRVLITPAIARKLARKLLEFAHPELPRLNSARPIQPPYLNTKQKTPGSPAKGLRG